MKTCLQIMALLVLTNQVFACEKDICAFDALIVKHDHDLLTRSTTRDDLSMPMRQDSWETERTFIPLAQSSADEAPLIRTPNEFLPAKRQHQAIEATRHWSPLAVNRKEDVLTAHHDHSLLSRGVHEDSDWRATSSDELARGASTEPLSRCD